MDREALRYGPFICPKVMIENSICHFDGNLSSEMTGSVHIMIHSHYLLRGVIINFNFAFIFKWRFYTLRMCDADLRFYITTVQDG